jgi:hypothetical protein
MSRWLSGFPPFSRKDPIEDTFVRIQPKQLNYIEILANDLGLSRASRNAHITSIIGSKWINTRGIPDVYLISKSQASLIIDKFKGWKEQAK